MERPLGDRQRAVGVQAENTVTQLGERLRFGLLPLIARLLLSLEFLVAVNGKISGWSGQAAYMASHGMRFIPPLLGAALAIELLGSICVITGFYARAAAATMFVYLGIVSIELHDFWNRSGGSAGMNQTEFFKNMGMMGGLLLLAVHGPGSWTLGALMDSARAARAMRLE
jgi:putative oxidoreductase